MNRKPSADATESKNLRMDGHSPRGSRETPATPSSVGGVGRLGKVVDRTPNMHVAGESDGLIVPRKQANKTGVTPVAEPVEGRGPAKGNTRRALLAPDSEPGKRGIDLPGVRQAKCLFVTTRGKSRMR